MKRVFLFLMIIFPVFGENDSTYVKKLSQATSQVQKEIIFLNYLQHLGNFNPRKGDSILANRKLYVKKFSNNGNQVLLLIDMINKELIGENSKLFHKIITADSTLKQALTKKIEDYNFAEQSQLELIDFILLMSSFCADGIDKKEEAIILTKAIQLSNQFQLPIIQSFAYYLLATYYQANEQLDEAIQISQNGLLFVNKENSASFSLFFLNTIGKIHYNMGLNERAEEVFLQANSLPNSDKLIYQKGKLYDYFGRLYSKINKNLKSIPFYHQSLLCFYEINNNMGLAITHNHIGKAFYKNKEYDLAEKNYQLSQQFYNQNPSIKGIEKLYYNFAELYHSKQQYYRATQYIKESITAAKQNNQRLSLSASFLLYSKLLDNQGKSKLAYAYLSKYLHYNDSLQKIKLLNRITDLGAMFESAQKEEKIVTQQQRLNRISLENKLAESELKKTKQQNQLISVIWVISIVLFIAIILIVIYHGKRDRLKKRQRQIELQQALLRTQMNPHFIFNAMIAIQSYIYDEDVSNSSKYLVHLSKLMRLILENSSKEFIDFSTEIEIMTRYLSLQFMRFEDRFVFTIDKEAIDEHRVIQVPPMFLQPFIENAIEHAGLDKVKGGYIKISCRIVDDLFIFTIRDNGIGRRQANKRKNNKNHQSMAIQLTEERIELLNKKYKRKGYLKIIDVEENQGGGTKIIIATPFKEII